MPTTAHVAELSLSAFWGGRLHEYATAETADKALARFGEAVSVDKVTDPDDGSVRWLVTCATQRGATGSYRLHSIACDYLIPVRCS